MRRLGTDTGFAGAKLSEVLPRSGRSLATVRMTDFLDAETWNRYRLRCAKLSEVLPRSERSLATVRMTDFLDATTWNQYRLRCAKLSEVVARSERSLATVRMTDQASVARFGQDDRKRVRRFECGVT
jgi:hypothetical protein